MSNQLKNRIIHFGAPVRTGQTVSAEASAAGLELLRIATSEVNISAAPKAIQPHFSYYKSTFAKFAQAAQDGTAISYLTTDYPGMTYGGDLIEVPLPILNCTWRFPLAEEVAKDLIDVHKAIPSMAKGKPNLTFKNYNLETLRHLISIKTDQTAACNEGSINISAVRGLRLIQKIATVFLKTHQYPAFIDEDHASELAKEHETYVVVKKDAAIQALPMGMNPPEADQVAFLIEEKFTTRRVNLVTPFATFPHTFTPTTIATQTGEFVFFAYNTALAKYDHKTVLDVIARYFMGFLGSSQEDACTTLSELRSAWGNICTTEAGKQLSHLFKIIDIALQTQTRVALFRTNSYKGCFLIGAGYELEVGGKAVIRTNFSEIGPFLSHTDDHLATLRFIFSKLQFTDEAARQARMDACTTMRQLHFDLQALSLDGGLDLQDSIKNKAHLLQFPNSTPLPINAETISFVLSFVADPSKDLKLLPYLHHTQLFSTDRVSLALGAFGSSGPSFRVTGGKKMDITKPMKVPIRSAERGQQTELRDVSKICVQVQDIELAIKHMEEVISDKCILNPFGNANSRVSDSYINRVFEKDSYDKIIAALRGAAKVTVTDGASARKRNHDEDEDNANKRRKVVYDF